MERKYLSFDEYNDIVMRIGHEMATVLRDGDFYDRGSVYDGELGQFTSVEIDEEVVIPEFGGTLSEQPMIGWGRLVRREEIGYDRAV